MREILTRSCLFAVALLCALSCGSGCSRREHPQKPGIYINADRTVRITELADDDPVLYVNGEKISRRNFEALTRLHECIWRISTGQPFDATEEEMADYRIKAGPSIMLQLIHHELFRQYAREIAAVPSAEQVRAAGEAMLRALRRKNATIDSLADAIGGDAGELFRKAPYVDAQDALLRQSVTTNDLDHVSEAEIQERLAFVAKFDANAEKLNAKARERLAEAKKRILAGADFAAEARNIADVVNPQYGEEWGRFEIQEFPSNEELHKWLLTAQPGDISDPVDLDDGLAIVKVVERGKGEAPDGVEPPDAFTLVRCTTKAFEKMRFQDRAEMTQQLLLWKREDAQRTLGTMLTDRAVIEYPNGTNLFDNVASAAKEMKRR